MFNVFGKKKEPEKQPEIKQPDLSETNNRV
jgi:hypothetical protein